MPCKRINCLPKCCVFFKIIRRTPGIPSRRFVWILSHCSWSFFDQVRYNGFITSSMMFPIKTDGFGKGCPKHFIQLWVLTESIARRNRASSGKIQSTLLAGCSSLSVAQRIVFRKDCRGIPLFGFLREWQKKNIKLLSKHRMKIKREWATASKTTRFTISWLASLTFARS